jgi:hypothetical protein
LGKWTSGGFVHRLVVQFSELAPLGEDGDGMRTFRRHIRVWFKHHALLDIAQRRTCAVQGVRIGDDNLGVLFQQRAADGQRRRIARIARIGLERHAEQGHTLAGDSIKHGGNHLGDKRHLLIFIHRDHLFPVGSHLLQAARLAQVDQVQDVFLETGATKTHAGSQETRPDPRVRTDGASDFRDISLRHLTQIGDGVDGRDALGQKGIGGQFGQLA